MRAAKRDDWNSMSAMSDQISGSRGMSAASCRPSRTASRATSGRMSPSPSAAEYPSVKRR